MYYSHFMSYQERNPTLGELSGRQTDVAGTSVLVSRGILAGKLIGWQARLRALMAHASFRLCRVFQIDRLWEEQIVLQMNVQMQVRLECFQTLVERPETGAGVFGRRETPA